METTLNSRAHNHPRADGVPGSQRVAVSMCGQESIEFPAGRVKGALLLLREAAMNQWSFIMGDDLADQGSNRTLSELGSLVDVSDDFATEQPKVVAVQVAGLARQTLSQQVQQERGEYCNDLLAGDCVTLPATPTCRPSRQIRAVGCQAWRGYDGAQSFLEFFWHASDLDTEPMSPLPRLRQCGRPAVPANQEHRSRGASTSRLQSDMFHLPPARHDL